MAPIVPESVLRKRRALDSAATKKKLVAKKSIKSARVEKSKTKFKRAEAFVAEHRKQFIAKRVFNSATKKEVKHASQIENKLAVVIRIKDSRNVILSVKQILGKLRLFKPYTAVFVRLDATHLKMLELVKRYVIYGIPNLHSVKELISKRGYGTSQDKPIPIADNTVIENSLGKYGIICVDDLIHEIFSNGEHFSVANEFLRPFKLTNPTLKIEKKVLHLNQIGQYGYRGDEINDLIKKMV